MSTAVCDSEPISSEPTSMDGLDWSARDTPEGLQAITIHYYDWSQDIATSEIKRIGKQVDADVVRSAAAVGLLDAIQKFEPSRGFKFRTFAYRRIRGQILDELRITDHFSRKMRSVINERRRAEADLIGELGREPTQEEVCDRLGWDRQQYLLSLARAPQSIDRPCNDDYDRPETVQALFGRRDRAGDLERSEAFEHMMRGFTMEEKTIVYLYYFREAPMRTIAAALSVSESRVSQVHKDIIIRLRAMRRQD